MTASLATILQPDFCSKIAVPLEAWTGPEGSRKLRLPDFMTTAQECGKVVSLTHWRLFTPRKYSWYSFLLEAESTPGPQCDWKDYVNEKSTDTRWDRSSDLPDLQHSTLTTVVPWSTISAVDPIFYGVHFCSTVICRELLMFHSPLHFRYMYTLCTTCHHCFHRFMSKYSGIILFLFC